MEQSIEVLSIEERELLRRSACGERFISGRDGWHSEHDLGEAIRPTLIRALVDRQFLTIEFVGFMATGAPWHEVKPTIEGHVALLTWRVE